MGAKRERLKMVLERLLAKLDEETPRCESGMSCRCYCGVCEGTTPQPKWLEAAREARDELRKQESRG